MQRKALLFRRLYTPMECHRDGVLTIVGERIESIRPLSEGARSRVHRELGGYEIHDAGEYIVLPGLIDIHLHGAFGQDFLTADPRRGLPAVARELCRFGVTGFLPTLGHAPWGLLVKGLGRVAEAASAPPTGANCLGINLEGPFLNPARVGAGSPRFCIPPSEELLEELADVAAGHLRIMTLAPELEGAMEIIPLLVRDGVVAAVGHTDATYEQIAAAVDAGVSLATHAFNAMAPFHHRAPGSVGALLGAEMLSAELIADGHHVHPGAMRALLRARGIEEVILVTDGTPLLGNEGGVYRDQQGREIRMESGACRAADGALAGGATPLNLCLANFAAATGLPMGEVVRTATLNPASLLCLSGYKGSLKPGRDADITVMDEHFEVQMTFVRGELCYVNSGRDVAHFEEE